MSKAIRLASRKPWTWTFVVAVVVVVVVLVMVLVWLSAYEHNYDVSNHHLQALRGTSLSSVGYLYS